MENTLKTSLWWEIFILPKKKKNLSFLLSVVLNVRFFPAMGSKVPKWMTVSRKTRGQKSSIGSFAIFIVCEFHNADQNVSGNEFPQFNFIISINKPVKLFWTMSEFGFFF